MIIAADPTQPRFAVVHIHKEIVGIYSMEHQAKAHARSLINMRQRQRSLGRFKIHHPDGEIELVDPRIRKLITCRWMPAEAVTAELVEYDATLAADETWATSDVRSVINAWLKFGEPNRSMLNEEGMTIVKI